jgi:hypothetical protein
VSKFNGPDGGGFAEIEFAVLEELLVELLALVEESVGLSLVLPVESVGDGTELD